MLWQKVGRIFDPGAIPGWRFSHASSPFPVWDEQRQRLRVWFTCRAADDRSHISWAEFDPVHDFARIDGPVPPLIAPGEPGMFDDSGCAMGCIVPAGNSTYLYYLGWNLKVTVPWLNTIGLAIAKDPNGPFKKWSRAPVMDRSDEDPFSISYPFILREGDLYRMWYGSNLGWGKEQDAMQHVIKYAESRDLLHWTREHAVQVPLMHPNEYALSRPWVLCANGEYHMWYSFRARNEIASYRIGYASSPDGKHWTRRDDEVGIDVSASGWDSEMISYAAVFRSGSDIYMIYNGNAYGRTGFGLARLIHW